MIPRPSVYFISSHFPILPFISTCRSSLGGGTCQFNFYSKWNWKFLPLKWEPRGVECTEVPKTNLVNALNRWCVSFKIFRHVNFTHCAPAEYWRLLVTGQIISINPTNGATVINALNLLRSGGLDFILGNRVRAALGTGNPLDILGSL